MFCLNQHSFEAQLLSPKPCEDLLDDLWKAIAYPGDMIMVLDPWYFPSALTRCWCLYELYLASAMGTTVSMAFGTNTQVVRALAENPNLANDIARAVDVRHA